MAKIAELTIHYSGGASNKEVARSLGGLMSSESLSAIYPRSEYAAINGVELLDGQNAGGKDITIETLAQDGSYYLRVSENGIDFGDYVAVASGTGRYAAETGTTIVIVSVDTGLWADGATSLLFSDTVSRTVSAIRNIPAALALTGDTVWWALFFKNHNTDGTLTINVSATAPGLTGSFVAGIGSIIGPGETDELVDGVPPVGATTNLLSSALAVAIPAGSEVPVWFGRVVPAGLYTLDIESITLNLSE